MIFTETVEIREITRDNKGQETAGTAVEWTPVIIIPNIEPKYEKLRVEITASIEIIGVSKNIPVMIKNRLTRYVGNLEAKIDSKWQKILLIDSIKSPLNKKHFVKLVINNS